MKVLQTPVDPGRRTVAACCGAHALHDGFSDLLYLLLPLWQAAFGLSLAQAGALKTIYSAAMAALQVPASLAAERLGERFLLTAGTLAASIALLASGWTSGYLPLALCLLAAGIGASVQHPLASALTSRAFDGSRLRAALATYNFSGDVGKVVLPAIAAALVAIAGWQYAVSLIGAIGIAASVALWFALPPTRAREGHDAGMPAKNEVGGPPLDGDADTRAAGLLGRGFVSLSAIGIVDSATRTGFLTLLPFILLAKGSSVTGVGLALSLVFAGGAAGKFVCGMLAIRLGVIRTTIITELATCAAIGAVVALPLGATMLLLPIVGLALNGTSSVLYGSVAELVAPARRGRAFGVFYTLTIGAGALSPMIWGGAGDSLGVGVSMSLVAASVLLVLPMTFWLRQALPAAESNR
jgi:MFS transporter, FSR family, fosmidomycin resistance protein